MLEVVIDCETEILTNSLQIRSPVGSVNGIDTNRLELHNCGVSVVLSPVWDVGYKAWS